MGVQPQVFHFGGGMLACGIATIAAYPFGLARTRMQVGPACIHVKLANDECLWALGCRDFLSMMHISQDFCSCDFRFIDMKGRCIRL